MLDFRIATGMGTQSMYNFLASLRFEAAFEVWQRFALFCFCFTLAENSRTLIAIPARLAQAKSKLRSSGKSSCRAELIVVRERFFSSVVAAGNVQGEVNEFMKAVLYRLWWRE